MKKKILITGGAGFIGSEFASLCIDNYETIVIDNLSYAGDVKRFEKIRENLKFYQVDICNREELDEIFEKENPNFIVHWAAESHVDRSIVDSSPFVDTNVKGTQNLLDISKKYNVEKFINIATDEVYGDLGEEGQFFEDTPLNPSSPYSVSKAAADLLGKSYYKTFNFPIITVRPSNNYGPWQYPEKLVPVVIQKALRNEKIPVYGNGENVREWLYVKDCARGVLEILNNGKIGDTYNIGSGEERKNIDVVKAILKILDKPESLIEFVNDRAGHDFRYSLNFEKIKTELNWEAQVKFEEGIEKTVKWYLENIQWVEEKKEELEKFWKNVY